VENEILTKNDGYSIFKTEASLCYPFHKNTDINFLLSINVNSKSPRKFELDRIDSMLKQKQTNKIRQKAHQQFIFIIGFSLVRSFIISIAEIKLLISVKIIIKTSRNAAKINIRKRHSMDVHKIIIGYKTKSRYKKYCF